MLMNAQFAPFTLYMRSEPAKSTKLSFPKRDLEGLPPTREGRRGSEETRMVKMQWERVEACVFLFFVGGVSGDILYVYSILYMCGCGCVS
jgi:hypothetical protein